MGKWAKSLFGKEKFSDVGIVVAGTNSPEFEKSILRLFDKVISSKDAVYHGHLVSKKGKDYPIVFNVYGAPAMVDVLTEMHDGGCKTIFFVGSAYGGFRNLGVGSIVLPVKSYHFEGIYHHLEPDRNVDCPDKELMVRLESLFKKKKIPYARGANISVPAVTFQLPHANEEYRKINPSTVEMELASCYSRAKDIGMRAMGILIISDNRKTSIGDDTKRKLGHDAKNMVLKTLIDNLDSFKMSPLPHHRKFSIDSHLASIIEDPEDRTNVYRKK